MKVIKLALMRLRGNDGLFWIVIPADSTRLGFSLREGGRGGNPEQYSSPGVFIQAQTYLA